MIADQLFSATMTSKELFSSGALRNALHAHLRSLQSKQLEAFLASLSTSQYGQQEGQEVLQEPASTGAYGIHYQTENAALVSVDAEKALAIDTLLPPFWKSRLLPAGPVAYIPVPEDAVAAVSLELSDDECARLEAPYAPHAPAGF